MISSAALTTGQVPDTSFYMIIAYGVIFLMTCAYVASLAIRWRRLQALIAHNAPDDAGAAERLAGHTVKTD